MTSPSLVWSRKPGEFRFGLGVERVYHDEALGLLSIEHDGSIAWDALQTIKDFYWGSDVAAIEVYPPSDRVVNNIPMRHLWKLGPDDWWPDLGHEGPAAARTLRERFFREADLARVTGDPASRQAD